MAINGVEGSKHTAADLELLDGLSSRQLMNFRDHESIDIRSLRQHLAVPVPCASLDAPSTRPIVPDPVSVKIEAPLLPVLRASAVAVKAEPEVPGLPSRSAPIKTRVLTEGGRELLELLSDSEPDASGVESDLEVQALKPTSRSSSIIPFDFIPAPTTPNRQYLAQHPVRMRDECVDHPMPYQITISPFRRRVGQHTFDDEHQRGPACLDQRSNGAQRVDETVAEEIHMSLRTGILANPNNEIVHRMARNGQRHTASARKSRESRQLTDVSKELQIRLSAEVEKHREFTELTKALKAQLKAAKEGPSEILTANSSGRVKTVPARSVKIYSRPKTPLIITTTVPVHVPSTMPSENTTLFPTTHFSEPMSTFIPPQPTPDFSKFFIPSYDPLPFGALTALPALEFPPTTSNIVPMEFSGIDFSTFDIDVFFGFDPTFNMSIPSVPPAEYPQPDYMNSFAPFFRPISNHIRSL
ncbi:hypothetical protein B0H17DRAFT_1149724 [Mycena rosella]|uniref:Uncharacterized protein n=1 Tax=Mycena rosella TaxID=1033263 RepID=A0AAD7FRS7_MYCRO|nr:hypothetical protein B0H17DRAFT_1149724 [Mycena rosella]